jgi:hypothetical protein
MTQTFRGTTYIKQLGNKKGTAVETELISEENSTKCSKIHRSCTVQKDILFNENASFLIDTVER